MLKGHAQARAALRAGEVLEFCRVVLRLALVKELAEDRVWRHRANRGAVLGRDPVEPGAGGRPAGTGHILDHHCRIAGDVARKMLAERAGVDAETPAYIGAGDEIDSLAGKEIGGR